MACPVPRRRPRASVSVGVASAASPELASQARELLRDLIRFNTVNPPGDERPAQEHLAAHLRAAGFECELLGAEPERPNLVARLRGDARRSDAVLPRPRRHRARRAGGVERAHDPWSGDVAEGYVWGRGALDMKSQVAAEIAAAASLARSGWRPARGELLIVAVVDEETGGALGAEWITREHPEKVRCDMLVNEGAGCVFEYGGDRRYGVCCAEKGVFRFTVTTDGVAGHASMPSMGVNALLKMAPLLERLGARQPAYELTDEPRAFLAAIGEDPDGSGGIGRAAARRRRAPGDDVRADARRHVRADPDQRVGEDQRDPQPGGAEGGLPRAAGPRRGGGQARDRGGAGLRTRPASGLGAPGETDSDPPFRIEFTERIVGNRSPMDSPLMDAISEWVSERDPGARTAPTILPGFTDSRHFRAAFPECVAYGFFPQRHQSLPETAPADPRRGRAHRRPRPGVRGGVLPGPGAAGARVRGGVSSRRGRRADRRSMGSPIAQHAVTAAARVCGMPRSQRRSC